MKTYLKLFSALFIAALFFFGWQFGINPIQTSIRTAESQGEKIKHSIYGRAAIMTPPANYISEQQHKIDVLHYDLWVELFPEEKKLNGNTIITALTKEDLPVIDLNFYDNMKINHIKIDGKNEEYNSNGTRLSINNSSEKDTIIIEINYEGKPKREGLAAFVFGKINERNVIYNLSEPNYASTWFPCNDMPSDKALLDIKIKNDSSLTSVSNGVLVSTSLDSGKKTYHWKTYYPISTYLICLYSSEYVSFSDQYISLDEKDTMNIDYYTFPEHKKNGKIDFKDHLKMMKFFAEAFGEYPFIKEKYGVAEFLWQFGAMEHQTITGIGSNFVSGRNFFNDIYVHELAHHWWGNAVGPKSWKDIWLNEGFSTYSEALYNESYAGDRALQSTMMSKFNSYFTGRLYDPQNDLFSQTIYDKGAWVLHMLRWEVGDSSFFKILRNYFEEYKYKTASTGDFIYISQKISSKNLKQFFDQWVYTGEDQININYSWNIIEGERGFILNLELKQIQNQYPVYHFPMEMEVVTESKKIMKKVNINSRVSSFSFEFDQKPNDIILDPNNWLLANIIDINSYE